MTPDKEEVKLFMELKTLEERGVGIWMEGHASDSKKVMETMSVNEDSTYMRDYIFQKGVLKEIHFDKIVRPENPLSLVLQISDRIEVALIVITVQSPGCAELFQIVDAHSASRPFSCLVQRRQKHSGKNCDD